MNGGGRWWAISNDDLLTALQRVEDGEKAADVLLDLYENGTVERSEDH